MTIRLIPAILSAGLLGAQAPLARTPFTAETAV